MNPLEFNEPHTPLDSSRRSGFLILPGDRL
jgi:hypothetical protein